MDGYQRRYYGEPPSYSHDPQAVLSRKYRKAQEAEAVQRTYLAGLVAFGRLEASTRSLQNRDNGQPHYGGFSSSSKDPEAKAEHHGEFLPLYINPGAKAETDDLKLAGDAIRDYSNNIVEMLKTPERLKREAERQRRMLKAQAANAKAEEKAKKKEAKAQKKEAKRKEKEEKANKKAQEKRDKMRK